MKVIPKLSEEPTKTPTLDLNGPKKRYCLCRPSFLRSFNMARGFTWISSKKMVVFNRQDHGTKYGIFQLTRLRPMRATIAIRRNRYAKQPRFMALSASHMIIHHGYSIYFLVKSQTVSLMNWGLNSLCSNIFRINDRPSHSLNNPIYHHVDLSLEPKIVFNSPNGLPSIKKAKANDSHEFGISGQIIIIH